MREYIVWLAKFVTVVLILAVLLPLVMAGIMAVSKTAIDGLPQSENGKVVSVVEITGVISSSKEVLEQLYKAAHDKKVKGIILRVDSPGGAVGPSQEIFSAVKTLKSQKPIVASMSGVAASGGLYVTLGASRVLAQPGTLTGSIGVLLQIPNFSKIASTVGVDFVTIKSGKLKDAGNTFRPMTDEERNFLEGTVIKANQDFISAVAEGRNIPREKVVQFADGRVILGSQARELGLVDGFGDIFDAGRAVFEILGDPLDEKEVPKLVYSGDKFERIRKILESFSGLGKLLSRAPSLQYIMY